MVGLQNNRIICSYDFKIQLQEKLAFQAFLEVLILQVGMVRRGNSRL